MKSLRKMLNGSSSWWTVVVAVSVLKSAGVDNETILSMLLMSASKHSEGNLKQDHYAISTNVRNFMLK